GDKIGKKNLREISDDNQPRELTAFLGVVFSKNHIICNKNYILYKNEKNKKINNTIPNEFQSNNVQSNSEEVFDNENKRVNSNKINPCGSNANFNQYSSSLYTSTEDYLVTSESSNSEMSLSSDHGVESKNISNSKLNLQREYASHAMCFICRQKSVDKSLMVLPIQWIVDVNIRANILIPIGARICCNHLNQNYFVKDNFISEIPIVDDSIDISK
ncbi:unnamed protein product, partial [Brachionus calyciflorus]